jgi:hypothetical protein
MVARPLKIPRAMPSKQSRCRNLGDRLFIFIKIFNLLTFDLFICDIIAMSSLKD